MFHRWRDFAFLTASQVEKIRQVGAIALQVSQSLQGEAVAVRAKTCLDTILDILTRLDSKAPEALYNSMAAS